MSDERETIQRNPESVAAWKRECAFLREQVEKLTKERDDLRSRRCEVCGYLEHEREHTGCLREQLAALTKERDELKTVPMKYRRMQFNAELQDEVTQLQKQLAALAEQNAKMRETLQELYELLPVGVGIAALSLPDLATPALNDIPKEPTLPVFDADSPRFRQVFDEAVQAHNLPGKRKGDGYRSPITQWCFEIAYSVVNRLRLYEK